MNCDEYMKQWESIDLLPWKTDGLLARAIERQKKREQELAAYDELDQQEEGAENAG